MKKNILNIIRNKKNLLLNRLIHGPKININPKQVNANLDPNTLPLALGMNFIIAKPIKNNLDSKIQLKKICLKYKDNNEKFKKCIEYYKNKKKINESVASSFIKNNINKVKGLYKGKINFKKYKKFKNSLEGKLLRNDIKLLRGYKKKIHTPRREEEIKEINRRINYRKSLLRNEKMNKALNATATVGGVSIFTGSTFEALWNKNKNKVNNLYKRTSNIDYACSKTFSGNKEKIKQCKQKYYKEFGTSNITKIKDKLTPTSVSDYKYRKSYIDKYLKGK